MQPGMPMCAYRGCAGQPIALRCSAAEAAQNFSHWAPVCREHVGAMYLDMVYVFADFVGAITIPRKPLPNPIEKDEMPVVAS